MGVAVKVVGLPSFCADTVSDIIAVARLPIGEPLNSFEKESSLDPRLRFDAFIADLNDPLKSRPNSQGLIALQLNRSDSRNYKTSLLRSIIDFLKFR